MTFRQRDGARASSIVSRCVPLSLSDLWLRRARGRRRIDYSGEGDSLATAQSFDANVLATMIRHGNFDYFNGEIVWDPDIGARALPASLLRDEKPAYFGSLAWPPFDPSAPPDAFDDENVARIPAGYRYVHGVDP